MAQSEPDKDRNFVTALARGLEVLRCFRPHEHTLSNLDLSERTGLPKPTVSRLTHTLCQLDYLVYDTASGGYRLGAGVLALGFGVLSGLEFRDLARAEMRALREGPNAYITVAMAERHRDEAIYLAVEASQQEMALRMQVGYRLPLFQSSIGRAMLVGMSEEERAQAFADTEALSPGGEAARRAIYAQTGEDYAANGFCSSYGDWRSDVNAIAVPVRAFCNGRIYGLNVGGPSFHLSVEELEQVYAPRLIAAATRLGTPV